MPLSHGDETLGGLCARLVTPKPAQICWVMQATARRDALTVFTLNLCSDLVLYDQLNVTVYTTFFGYTEYWNTSPRFAGYDVH